ncbi:unnamed protein product, partial [Choristocarpus tenellus]
RPAYAVAWVKPNGTGHDNLVSGGDDRRVVIWLRVLDQDSTLQQTGVSVISVITVF